MRTCIVLLIVAMAAVYVIVMPTVLSDADGYVQISVINGTRAQGLGRWAVYEYDSKNHARIFFNKVLRGRRMGSSWFDLIINESISDSIYRNYEASLYQHDRMTQPKLISFTGAYV
ncbi:uncharacterized protein [Setaria viridis]|uniref:uncharacterized protein n=1 Tax=Setaria viridis TaxID=4556 RepID=UPI0014933E53|nr:uncharacterized protein LOC117864673 [Setaria viridis]